ncbi:MAG TPA: GIY-YIG nuclease family protein [Dehalococcoidia bacterium]|nr:GIY-YIG nuclease family protein [Dehalococcoidia bacterium]
MNTALENSIDGSARGGYILIAQLNTKEYLDIGRLGTVQFPQGFYSYLGSALGGFKTRLNRHLAIHKKMKWHIDYFLQRATLLQIILLETPERVECPISRILTTELPFIPGFGASDCQCHSHLYFAKQKHILELNIRKAIDKIGSPAQILVVAKTSLEV